MPHCIANEIHYNKLQKLEDALWGQLNGGYQKIYDLMDGQWFCDDLFRCTVDQNFLSGRRDKGVPRVPSRPKKKKNCFGKVGWETGVNSKLFILFFKLISYFRVKLVQTLHASISNLIVVIFHKFAWVWEFEKSRLPYFEPLKLVQFWRPQLTEAVIAIWFPLVLELKIGVKLKSHYLHR